MNRTSSGLSSSSKAEKERHEKRNPSLSTAKAIAGFIQYKSAEGLSPRTLTGYEHDYYDMLSVTRTDDLGGRAGIGSQYHCVHELGDVTFTIIDWEPPHHFISDELALRIPIQFTMQFLPHADGTRIRILYQEPDQVEKEGWNYCSAGRLRMP